MEKRKKAVVIGGSNGIGAAVSRKLADRGYIVEICDRSEPDRDILQEGTCNYQYCDLSYFDESLFYALASDPDVNLLMVTAGIGRIADFQFHHITEIEKTLTIDTVSTIKIFRIFYERILNDDSFYAGVMGSISGWISSPSASVYAAAKAGVIRFVESVNIELEAYGSKNRILDVSPASFKGSRFYGGKNDLSVTGPFAEQILSHLFSRSTRFIPQYEETFHAVLERYHDDPHKYGLHSYQYKKESGRLDNRRRVQIGYISCIFEGADIAFLNRIRQARQNCDYLIVGLRAYPVLPSADMEGSREEKKALLSACRYIDLVVDAPGDDIEAWNQWHYDRLFQGEEGMDLEMSANIRRFLQEKNVQIMPLCDEAGRNPGQTG